MSLILFLLLISSPSIAGLQNAQSLTKLSPGAWDIRCSGGQRERKTGQEILNQQYCLGLREDSRCVEFAKSLLPSIQRDDPEEMQEIISACGRGSNETHKCLEISARRLESRYRDERNEVIKLINICGKPPIGVEKCLEFGFTRVQKRKTEIVFGIASACSETTESAPLCLIEASRNLIQNEIDDLHEVTELIRACGVAHLETDTCLQEAKKNSMSELNFNERSEIIPMIKACH